MKVGLLYTVLVMLFCIEANAQWTELRVDIQGCWGSDVQAIDYDMDGDLDLFISGSTDPSGNGLAKLYRNNSNGTFTFIPVSIKGFYKGCSAWADFDRDGRMDFVTTGRNNESEPPFTLLYQGSAKGSFTPKDVGWLGLYYAWVDCGDYDNDGLTDILMIGENGDQDYCRIYRNNGGMSFTCVDVGLQGAAYGQCHFVDFDNDGDLDISVVGSNQNLLYRNDGGSSFLKHSTGFYPVKYSGSAWGDMDSDGYPDLIAAGEGTNGPRVDLYHNKGDGSFEEIPMNIPGTLVSNLFWGDFDNDGLLDFLMTGSRDYYGERVVDIYRNKGFHCFEKQEDTFVPISSGRTIWADLNNDSKLDIISVGYNGEDYLAKVYLNNTPNINVPPTPPIITYNPATHTIEFLAGDNSTGQNGITYNLRLGTKPGAEDIFSVLEGQNGFRSVVERGRQKYRFRLQPGISYYASAQAIDNSFVGSAFSQEVVLKVKREPR